MDCINHSGLELFIGCCCFYPETRESERCRSMRTYDYNLDFLIVIFIHASDKDVWVKQDLRLDKCEKTAAVTHWWFYLNTWTLGVAEIHQSLLLSGRTKLVLLKKYQSKNNIYSLWKPNMFFYAQSRPKCNNFFHFETVVTTVVSVTSAF